MLGFQSQKWPLKLIRCVKSSALCEEVDGDNEDVQIQRNMNINKLIIIIIVVVVVVVVVPT